MDIACDIAIVGAGMAGASLAAAIGERARVLVIEAEDRPGYHATGRSAAFWTESYGGPGVQPLTTASGPALRALGMLTPRAALTLAREDQAGEIERFAATYEALGVAVERLDRAGIEARVPGVRAAWTRAALEPSCCDIDVAALHQHYLSTARSAGAQILSRAGLVEAERVAGGWRLALADGSQVRCAVLADAAGAWADEVARRAGIAPIGIVPYRRTVAQLAVDPAPPADLPLVLDIAENFYFKPEAGRIWLSPHDETATTPCDAAPEELDVAVAIDRFESVVDWRIARLEHKWAGLRSFAPDRLPVYGFAPGDEAFFWFAGQGGFGIQTAPAAAELGAALLLGLPPGSVDPETFRVSRF